MEKSTLILFFALIVPFSSYTSGSNNRSGKERAIYFCHRDIESYINMLDLFQIGFIGREESEEDLYDGSRDAKHFSTNLGKPPFHFRHCFFLIADKVDEHSDQNKIILSLEKLESRGYGKAGLVEKDPVSGGEDKEAIKYKPMSCVSIVENNDHDRELISKRLGYNHILSHLYAVWGEILDLMDKRETEKYNIFGNNCCTVAYGITKLLIGEKNALKKINPSSFNLKGMGILWGSGPFSSGEATESTMRSVREVWHMFQMKERPVETPESNTLEPEINEKEEL